MPTSKGKGVASFPVELPLRCIRLLSYESNLVFDPFMGSGTTAEAAVRSNRDFFGCDINPEYVEMALNRVERTREKHGLRLF